MTDHLNESRELVAILNTVFHQLDQNHDNVLQAAELDGAVIDPALTAEFASAVAVLKAGFADIRELHKEGWFARKNGITLGDLLVFEKLLLMEEAAGAEKHDHLRGLTEHVRDRVLEVSRMKRDLYRNMTAPLESIVPDAIRQGMVGDCYFLAALGSVVATNPQIVPRIIKAHDDGTFTVTFPGAREEPITVQAPGMVELSLYAQITQYGIWPAVLEKAYGQYLNNTKGYKHTVIPADATEAAQHVYESFDLLTGQMGRWQFLAELSDEDLSKSLTSSFREKRAVAAATYPSARGDRDLTVDGIPTQHAYSVLAWNAKVCRLTLRNPWGAGEHAEPENSRHEPEDGRRDGVFNMNFDHLRRNFVALYYEDWLPDAQYV